MNSQLVALALDDYQRIPLIPYVLFQFQVVLTYLRLSAVLYRPLIIEEVRFN